MPSDSVHYWLQQARIISRLLCVISVDYGYGFFQARTLVHHPVSVCRRCKTSRHSFSNETWIQQWLCAAYWCKNFNEGRSNTEDVTCPYYPPHVTNPDTCAKVDLIVQCDCHVTLQRISEYLGFSVERVNHNITEVLGCWKVSAVWVMKSWIDEQKAAHLGICPAVCKRGRQIFGSYCCRGQVLVFALWSRN